jgi:hypothetical protein
MFCPVINAKKAECSQDMIKGIIHFMLQSQKSFCDGIPDTGRWDMKQTAISRTIESSDFKFSCTLSTDRSFSYHFINNHKDHCPWCDLKISEQLPTVVFKQSHNIRAS